MGNLCSKQVVLAVAKKALPLILNQLGLNFSMADWNKYHNQGSVEQNQSDLENLGTDLKKCSTLPTNLKRAAFVCCNTYTRPDYSLGVGPMNDAITVATYMKELGFAIYFAHNPTSKEYLKYFKHFLGNTTEYLLVYYTGHGASVDDTNGDETDGKDEALVFDDNFLVDDKLADAIANSGKPASSIVCLLSDCCHSGSIYDLQNKVYKGRMPGNVMSLSAARDSETAKQTSVEGNDQGIFTFYFYKLLSQDATLTPRKMESQIGQYLKKFDQNFVIDSTTDSLLNQTIFQ